MRDQLPVGWERSQHSASQRRSFAEKCVGTIAVVRTTGRDGRLGAKTHPVQHVLAARRWKHFFDAVQVVARGRLVTPQHEQVAQPVVQAPAPVCVKTYTVLLGDGWLRIADAHSVALDELLASNNANVSTFLMVGSTEDHVEHIERLRAAGVDYLVAFGVRGAEELAPAIARLR